MTALRFAGLGRHYGDVAALENVTLELASGTRTAIIGPSGSGKSSLLNIAAGLDNAYSGTVRRDPAATVGYAFQDHRLLPWLTARANVGFALSAAGWHRSRTRARAEEMLWLVGLSGSADAFPATLSGGMRQRVALARALAVRPSLLLLDEPFAAVDEDRSDQLCAAIRAETTAYGATILLVTHRYREAAQLADRAVILVGGRVVDDASFARLEPGDADVDAAVENRLRTAARRAGHAQTGSLR